ncbi:ABC transporter ATP-binding protein [Tindallia californiensis]|uniref:Putative ABC transport system ATP-binding protein n=1 Tax=Tindallia californiensis TaxID=159292 RepID=A0A1H3MC06_9FIRM|nr:ABC transporter ATP-binding protein [Tindallia californiensis]SDY74113.1 putative ABC transport system ATP-binding protein [Tindallia californiensis]
MIQLENVRKVYRLGDEKVVAVDRISLSVDKGEVCCFLGTSGSGKSTLLNLMAGLEKPTKGKILIQQRRIDLMNEKQLALFRQRHIGFVFQSYNLMPLLTAEENVSLPLTFRGVSKQKRLELARKMLKDVGLAKYVKHRPSQMSGGQQQRVGIARAFVAKPPVIFADEPTGNLDSKTSKEVLDIMLGMASRQNQTLIIVTHDPSISKYANRVFTFLDGNIKQEDKMI